ncbi:MAG: hypothetical protein JXA73_12015, partial [Acidobacteria bacterium]|nr:hypothetical protein [Acidobacteriota bacterium]
GTFIFESRQPFGTRRRAGICGVAAPRQCPSLPASRRLAFARPALASKCKLIVARALSFNLHRTAGVIRIPASFHREAVQARMAVPLRC